MKQMLMLRTCGVYGEEEECNNIKNQSQLYGLEVHDYCPKSNEDLNEILAKGIRYEYIYLSSHGSTACFGNESQSVEMSWEDFGTLLCENDCLAEDCTVLLSCCRGGLNQVAYTLFYSCSNISYIIGPKKSLSAVDMMICFGILLYCIEKRAIDPVVACSRVTQATDIRFASFDRLETETEIAFIKWGELHGQYDFYVGQKANFIEVERY